MLNDQEEIKRLQEMLSYEKKAKKQGFQIVAGIDEAGRGPLAGPVVAAACILPPKALSKSKVPLFPELDDSKKLLPAQRERLFETLTSHPQICYGIGIIDHLIIDAVNIFQATIKAMFMAIEALCNNFNLLPDLFLVDGLNLKHPTIESWKIIKGDQLSQSVAAASVLAKVTRDKMMAEYDQKWPEYGFKKHKGYPTVAHFKAIEKHGPCPIHRLRHFFTL